MFFYLQCPSHYFIFGIYKYIPSAQKYEMYDGVNIQSSKEILAAVIILSTTVYEPRQLYDRNRSFLV